MRGGGATPAPRGLNHPLYPPRPLSTPPTMTHTTAPPEGEGRRRAKREGNSPLSPGSRGRRRGEGDSTSLLAVVNDDAAALRVVLVERHRRLLRLLLLTASTPLCACAGKAAAVPGAEGHAGNCSHSNQWSGFLRVLRAMHAGRCSPHHSNIALFHLPARCILGTVVRPCTVLTPSVSATRCMLGVVGWPPSYPPLPASESNTVSIIVLFREVK